MSDVRRERTSSFLAPQSLQRLIRQGSQRARVFHGAGGRLVTHTPH